MATFDPSASPAGDARIVATADGSRTLYSERYGQTLHSSHGAAAEARWVFLAGSGVEERLRRGAACHVLEVGFGTGLNFLVTADAARTHGARLRYAALERELPARDVLARLGHREHLRRPELADELHAALDGVRDGDGWQRPLDVGDATLELALGEATDTALPAVSVHAVYHDAFSPDANPELWTEAFLARLAAALVPGGALVTYTVAGAVRRALAATGLEVAKRPGPPGGKREMLFARKAPTARG